MSAFRAIHVGAPVLAFAILVDIISSWMKGLELQCQVGSSGRTQISGFLHPVKSKISIVFTLLWILHVCINYVVLLP